MCGDAIAAPTCKRIEQLLLAARQVQAIAVLAFAARGPTVTNHSNHHVSLAGSRLGQGEARQVVAVDESTRLEDSEVASFVGVRDAVELGISHHVNNTNLRVNKMKNEKNKNRREYTNQHWQSPQPRWLPQWTGACWQTRSCPACWPGRCTEGWCPGHCLRSMSVDIAWGWRGWF